MNRDSLGDRMKSYENITRTYLPGRMPEIEVEIVQHGQWIPMRPYMYSVKCSVCGKIWELETLRCPSCGAKMDLEEPIDE